MASESIELQQYVGDLGQNQALWTAWDTSQGPGDIQHFLVSVNTETGNATRVTGWAGTTREAFSRMTAPGLAVVRDDPAKSLIFLRKQPHSLDMDELLRVPLSKGNKNFVAIHQNQAFVVTEETDSTNQQKFRISSWNLNQGKID